eukprot:CAMPEP_0203923590 /NCGR_PEP_ID=MMETSP0359-20131031/63454_1 /ASSEMBLY_ACC=CAM_ASM_000338 /TAXON_ID=268821 /ORGANISM="Scrippsiella Hangoei, Strain SHTV-5" /LENGTH=138 /DNA_ID=CAMNT_0050851687 /DNA_START=140 /DNA_END=557 /DNA_ORIENTATION=+
MATIVLPEVCGQDELDWLQSRLREAQTELSQPWHRHPTAAWCHPLQGGPPPLAGDSDHRQEGERTPKVIVCSPSWLTMLESLLLSLSTGSRGSASRPRRPASRRRDSSDEALCQVSRRLHLRVSRERTRLPAAAQDVA